MGYLLIARVPHLVLQNCSHVWKRRQRFPEISPFPHFLGRMAEMRKFPRKFPHFRDNGFTGRRKSGNEEMRKSGNVPRWPHFSVEMRKFPRKFHHFRDNGFTGRRKSGNEEIRKSGNVPRWPHFTISAISTASPWKRK